MLTKKVQRAEFVPARLRQARKAKGWTMSRLSDEVQLTRQAVSQFEKGASKPSPEKLRELARSLDQPEQFFTWPITDMESKKESVASFRSMASSTARARDQAETWLEWLAALLSVLSEKVQLPDVGVPNFAIEDFTRLTDEDIDEFAMQTRRHFALGNGPISNLTLLLENKGVVICYKRLNQGLSGISQWFTGRPIVIIDPSTSASRARFSLAHELGHLVLHRQITREEELFEDDLLKLIERQANRFSSAFMLPEDSLAQELYGIDWQALLELKGRWHMAISAIVMRLADVRLITENQKVRIFRELSAKGARRREPLDREIPHDPPRLLKKVAELVSSNSVLRYSDMPDVIRFNTKLVAEFLQIPVSALSSSDMPDNVILLRRRS